MEAGDDRVTPKFLTPETEAESFKPFLRPAFLRDLSSVNASLDAAAMLNRFIYAANYVQNESIFRR
jgi:hypothetical protein